MIESDTTLYDNGFGTGYFQPPESAISMMYDRIKGDIWALGVTLFSIAFGYLPFEHEQSEQTDLVPKN